MRAGVRAMASELGPRAREARDEIGWTDSNDAMQVTFAMLQLARVVVDMAEQIDRLTVLVESGGDKNGAADSS